MAPATLIDKRIQWLEANDQTVTARFTSQGISVTATLYFAKNGALINFTSPDRFAINPDNSLKRTPWSTPVRGYKTINGFQLPAMAETIYNFPAEDLCYGSFLITNVIYNPSEIAAD